MPRPTYPRTKHFSHDDLRRIVAKHLPAWKRACAASDSNAIVLHESAFGRSHSELLLLACAIKYAALNKKHIHIACGDDRVESEPLYRKAISVRTYREDQSAAAKLSRQKRERKH